MYMSPEQLDGQAGQGYLGTAVDVWAGGVLLIVMLLGSPPTSPGLHPAVARGRPPNEQGMIRVSSGLA